MSGQDSLAAICCHWIKICKMQQLSGTGLAVQAALRVAP